MNTIYFLALIIFTLPMVSFANTPMDSINLAGEYELEEVLIEVDQFSSSIIDCHPNMTIRVTDDELVVLGPSDGRYRTLESRFTKKGAGCHLSQGDISEHSKQCTTFKKNSVTAKDSEATILGYMRNVEKIKLINKGTQLIHSFYEYFIPLGIFFENSDRACLYNKL